MDTRRSTRCQDQRAANPQVPQPPDPGVARRRQETPQQVKGRDRPRAPSLKC